MRIIVIGGGVIGLWSAVELARAGAEVTVLDAGPQAGFASPAAAGWVVPALSAPLSGPGVLMHSARQALHREAPFSVAPRLTSALLRWLVGFVRSGSARQYAAGLRAVLDLGAGCVDDFARLQETADLDMRQTGLLMAALTQAGLDEVAQLAEATTAAGYKGGYEVLDGQAARSREPALGTAITGAVHAVDEVQVRPEQVLRALREQLSEAGGRLVIGTASRLGPADSGWRVETNAGTFVADRLLVAAGAWSTELLAVLGVRLPLMAATGYSITTPGTGRAPQLAVKLVEPSIAVTPFADGVRIAARLDLGRPGGPIPERRLAAVLNRTRPYFADWRPGLSSATFAGMRPATPDSLPLIGPIPGHRGLYVATGHGMLGLTLAPGTARYVVPLVLDEVGPAELKPFAPERYLLTGAWRRP
ncbi:D-amino-acid dehydrogenase [Kribbella steppae]|uniref:D-amino-acid dehydrogenase n=1 Tax=Kribbella steppae TaxID=2512223 RepID=A0A4R2HRI0_9ACTN|nr:FAD-dependent oxidoreductase [Kribbella steppae]TCO33599.1 D-amino-acid dehydrogenase [Kribbella steppae]